jgi:hypothetical protein
MRQNPPEGNSPGEWSERLFTLGADQAGRKPMAVRPGVIGIELHFHRRITVEAFEPFPQAQILHHSEGALALFVDHQPV